MVIGQKRLGGSATFSLSQCRYHQFVKRDYIWACFLK